ncbi:MAG: diheme cytochrome c, partial [Desulfobacterales bacterium]
NCGACHYAYQPGLLPSNSWKKILDNLDNHFGEIVDIAPPVILEISEFLKANGANQSNAKLSRKIMKSLRDKTPLRISQIPYIHKKHDDIPQSIFSRKSIGSLSNCSACHTTAEKGIYDDDNVTIPRQ